MRLLRSLLLLVLAAAAPAAGQQVTTSPAPEAVAVTVYRAPFRSAEEPMQLQWLNGYALISETRRVSIPAGDGAIRFEGVAGGIIPESAIVTGLPEGVIEKNQDAYLLSPASLLDRSLGRRVHIRRTSAATGKAEELEAVIRSGPEGAIVLQTEQGFEALRCTGLKETIVYPRVLEGLSAKPTLSVRTRSAQAASATVTLSYLASGFDWQANYVATLSPDADRVDLFAWVTLANGDETSFANANTQTVAGKVNREDFNQGPRPSGAEVHLRCWPSATTSDIEQRESWAGGPPPPPPPPPPAMAPMAISDSSEIVVTGSRVNRKAVQEELGDLKLYRIPDPVTVASRSQKQVAMLDQPGVKVEVVYRIRIPTLDPPPMSGVSRILVTKNRKAEGLGLPLPAGRVVLFGAGRERPLLLGEGFVEDKAVGEDVEIEIGSATGVIATTTVSESPSENERLIYLTVTNDRARPVRFEAELDADESFKPDSKLARRDGRPLWSVMVPANGSRTLRYRTRKPS